MENGLVGGMTLESGRLETVQAQKQVGQGWGRGCFRCKQKTLKLVECGGHRGRSVYLHGLCLSGEVPSCAACAERDAGERQVCLKG